MWSRYRNQQAAADAATVERARQITIDYTRERAAEAEAKFLAQRQARSRAVDALAEMARR